MGTGFQLSPSSSCRLQWPHLMWTVLKVSLPDSQLPEEPTISHYCALRPAPSAHFPPETLSKTYLTLESPSFILILDPGI